MTIEQAKKEYEETISAGNLAFATGCLGAAIKQAKECEEKKNEGCLEH